MGREGEFTHSTEISEVANFPSEASLVCDRYPILSLRPGCRSIHWFPGVCVCVCVCVCCVCVCACACACVCVCVCVRVHAY